VKPGGEESLTKRRSRVFNSTLTGERLAMRRFEKTALFFLFLVLFLPLRSFAMERLPVNRLDIRFDLDQHKLTGASEISLPAGTGAVVDLTGLTVISVSIDNRAIKIDPKVPTLTLQPSDAKTSVKIDFSVEISEAPVTDITRNPGVVRGNVIGPSGISLTERWYPALQGLSLYHLSAALPKGFEGISEADEISSTVQPDGGRVVSFSFPHPLEHVDFIAGPYVVEKESFQDIEIYTYFLAEDAGLSKTYLGHARKYFEMYNDLLGKYQYRRFSIVENILPTGYSMPTFTLLGGEVLKLPFIVDTSLGHEILHQWFGNLVYVDYTGGNWSEGLTTCLADQRFEELKGKGSEYRKGLLMGYQSYVTPQNDFPLSSFVSRTDRVTGAVGYGKATMVFQMLKNLVGERTFYEALRAFINNNRFRPASWADIRTSFEKVSGKKLDWFFSQWVGEKGEPNIGLKNVAVNYRGSKAIVSFDLVQKGKAYQLSVPVVLRSKEGQTRLSSDISKGTANLDIETTYTPEEMAIDDNYDLFRALSPEEFPPVISRLLGADKKIFVTPEGMEKAYSAVAEYFRHEGFRVKKEEDIKYDDIKASSLVIPGEDTSLARRLYANIEKTDADFSITVRTNPFNSNGVIALIEGVPSDMPSYMERTTHYGEYSHLAFKGGKNILKAVDKSRNGIGASLSDDVPAVETKTILSIPDIIDKAAGKKIIYVGEIHNRFEDHRAEFNVIRALHKKNSRIAIGMEMFQKPFQQILDDYIAGKIDEREFLKKSEYFKRWSFDYTLYREILLYAREYKIPVIALNIRGEVVSKVAKSGLLSLSKEELKDVPEDMNLSDSPYRKRLKEFYGLHQEEAPAMNFDFFYEAQVLWDESMAHNLNDFMQKHPDLQVVVLAGGGHLAYGSGIPDRAYRLNKQDYSIVLNSIGDTEKEIADYLLYPKPITPPESAKLMVLVKEEDGKLVVSGFPPGSISEEAGMEEGDVILSCDDTKIEDIADLKIFLLYKKKGDPVTVTVMRKRFLFGPIEKKIKVTL
jgi:aminopeptidase N